MDGARRQTAGASNEGAVSSRADEKPGTGAFAPQIPDFAMIRRIGRGTYGEVWLSRNHLGQYRAVKIVRRNTFSHERPFEREFEGIKKFEPISREHEGVVAMLHVGRGEDFFYYVMELADDAGGDWDDGVGE